MDINTIPFSQYVPIFPNQSKIQALPTFMQDFYTNPLKDEFQRSVQTAQAPKLFSNADDQALFEQVFKHEQTGPQADFIAARSLTDSPTFPYPEVGAKITYPFANPLNANAFLSELSFEKLGRTSSNAEPDTSGLISPDTLKQAHTRLFYLQSQRPGIQITPLSPQSQYYIPITPH